jgi:hypothetical protein
MFERIAFPVVEPMCAMIAGNTEVAAFGEGPAANAIGRFKEYGRFPSILENARCREARRTGTHNDYIGINLVGRG